MEGGEKILKYKDLTIEMQSMWNVKIKTTPVIIGVTGTISKSLRQYLSNIPGKHEMKELKKKKSHTGHCTHTMERTNVKVQNIFNVRNITNKQTNSVALVRSRTIPTERPPPVGEVSANFCG